MLCLLSEIYIAYQIPIFKRGNETVHFLVFLSQLSFSNLCSGSLTYPHRCTHMHKRTHTHKICLVYIGIYFHTTPKIYIYTDLNLYLTPLLWSKIEGQQQALSILKRIWPERLPKGQDLLERSPTPPSPHWWYSGPYHGSFAENAFVAHSLPPHIRWRHQPLPQYQPTLPHLQLGTQAFFPNDETTQWPNAESPLYGRMYS